MSEKGKDKPKHQSFAEALGAIVGKQPPPSAPSARAVTTSPSLPSRALTRLSVEVRDPQRAGRAPYNFVPLPDSALFFPDGPPSQDCYHDGLLSGEIQVEWTALTDFYIRGMLSLEEHAAGRDNKDQVLPFLINEKLVLPGSSLRGLLRNTVEILGSAPLDPVNDSQLFFRTVASSPNPRDGGSFEPQTVAYKSRMKSAEAGYSRDCVQAGFLYASRSGWKIRPAQVKGGRQWYRFASPQKWAHPKRGWFKAVFDSRAEWFSAEVPGSEPGWLLQSGGFPKKKSQWILRTEDASAAPLEIPEWDVAAYKESGVTRDILRHHAEFSDQSQAQPCFFVKWQDASGKEHVSFGHTHFFRLPYVHSVGDAIPESCRRNGSDERWDRAQLLFGRTAVSNSRKGARTRLFVEDASFVSGPPNPISPAARQLVLSQPRPTTFQHYVVQVGISERESIHWDGNYEGQGEAVVRGHKAYWHRPAAIANVSAPSGKDNVASQFRPVRAGCRFTGRIRFENLHPEELGLLLCALELPSGCAHKLGMGKPYGFGSFRTAVSEVVLTNRKRRYTALFDGAAALMSASGTASAAQRQDWKQLAAIDWSQPRLADFKSLLTFDSISQREDWTARTRYLEIEGKNGNEYLRPSRRRPLPPASQVLTDSKLPGD